METTIAQEKKISPNDVIIHMVMSANVGSLDTLYRWADKHLETLSSSGDFYWKLKNALKQKPAKMIQLSELKNDVKNLIRISEASDYPAFMTEKISETITSLIAEWKNADAYRYHNLGVRNKILLHGPTGNGKTTIARNIAKLADLPFVEINTDAVIDSHMGATGAHIGKIFQNLNQKCVLFWDEIDSIGKIRGSRDNTGVSAENDRMVNSMLVNIEKMGEDVVFIGATNRREILDPAFIRRFDEEIEILSPGFEEKISFRDWIGEYYKIPELEWNDMDLSRLNSYSEIKTFFIKKARNYVARELLNSDPTAQECDATDAK